MSFIFWVILIGAMFNLICAARFYHVVRHGKSPTLPLEQQEDAVVIMAVRGCDPTLRKTVTGLLNQNFRSYRVVVVVDSKSDPAWDVLQAIKVETDRDNRMSITEMEPPRPNCSLKCNAIIGAVETLPVETQWIAFLDADVDVHPDWLADVLGPLTNPKVCVSTGNQWFEPDNRKSNGALLRSIWNAGAIVPSVLLEHAWAGSMAVRYEDLIISRLIDDWKTAIVDDGPMADFSKLINGQIYVSPKLLMVNREDCTNTFATSWITRMLTWSRLYESTFFLTGLHAGISAFFVFCLVSATILAVLTLDFVWLFFCLLTWALASAMLVGGYLLVRKAVSHSLKSRGLPELKPLDGQNLVALGLRMWLVQLLYFYSCFKASQLTSIKWRGVEYLLKGKAVELVEYQPYQNDERQKSPMSL